jgi:hypothetical protein
MPAGSMNKITPEDDAKLQHLKALVWQDRQPDQSRQQEGADLHRLRRHR